MLNKLKQKLLLLTTIGFIVAINSACKDDIASSNPLVGTWYEVTSTNEIGIKVVFTETNLTAIQYANNYYFEDSVLNYEKIFAYNYNTYIIVKDEIKIIDCPFNEMCYTKYSINNDTLFLEYFSPDAYGGLNPIYLIRECGVCYE